MFLEQIEKGENSIWNHILAFAIIFIAFILANGAAGILISSMALKNGVTDVGIIQSMNFRAMGIEPNVGYLIIISSFVLPFFSFVLVAKSYRRSFLSFITSRSSFSFRLFLLGIVIWLTINLLSSVLDYFSHSQDYQITFNSSTFVGLILISIIFIPLQTGFEEIFFRGYLMQLFSKLFCYKWIALVVSSLCFALMHSMNPEVHKFGFWVMMPSYFLLGLFLGLLALYSGGLEIGWGVHFLNNFFAAVFVNYSNSALQIDSLFTITVFDPKNSWIGIFISALLFLFVMVKIAKWNLFDKKQFGKLGVITKVA